MGRLFTAAAVLAGAVACCRAETEDLVSVKHWFATKNSRLSHFVVTDKQPIDSTYSVMALTALDQSETGRHDPWFGVFVVYGRTNQVYMVLDVSRAPECCAPKLEGSTNEAVYLEWVGDYGIYGGSYKYSYNLQARRLRQRFPYRRFAVQRTYVAGDEVRFAGSYTAGADAGVSGSLPEVNVVLAKRLTGGAWVVQQLVGESAAPPQQDATIRVNAKQVLRVQASGVTLDGKLYPVPVPSRNLYKQLRSETSGTIENHIGPFAFDGERLWFANKFYDGEGTSGVGALGSFDVSKRKCEIRYLQKMAAWSGSALLLDGDSIWIGLMRQPEGSAHGGGVLRVHKATGAVETYGIQGLVSTVLRAGGALYFATDRGLFELNPSTDELAHIRVEPGPAGEPTVYRTTP